MASTYALVASTNVARYLHTLDMIAHSSNYIRDLWTFEVDTLCNCTTLCCDSSNDMCAYLLLDCLQGPKYLLVQLRLSLPLDPVKLVGRLLGGKAWGQCLTLTLATPSLYPSTQVLIQSLEWIPDPATTHPVCFVPTTRMSLPPIWVQFHQCVHVIPLILSFPTMLPYPIYVAHVVSGVAPLNLATPSLFPPSSVYLSPFVCYSCHHVTSSPLSLRFISPQVGLPWTCSFFCLCIVNNISLSFVTRRYVTLCYRFYWCSPRCFFTNHSTTMSTGSLGPEK